LILACLPMGYELIITEKPSAAQKIAYALADSSPKKLNLSGVPYYTLKHKGRDIVVACAVGHLYTVTEKKKSFIYPSFDIEWRPTSDVDKNAAYSKKYLNAIKELCKDADAYTVACDYDIEGELIGYNCVRFICKQKDAERMKFSTLTKPDLVESYSDKNPTIDWGQANAGETRHVLDWLYGINLSRALTLSLRKAKVYKTLSSGRVQGPALKIIVDRELEIRKFVPQKYWQLELHGSYDKDQIVAMHEMDKFWDEKQCDSSLKKTSGHDGIVKSVERKEFKQPPPFPFDLTTLQTEAYRVFGISPSMALSVAQELYLAGVISYPRTSSQKLPAKIGFPKIMQALSENPEYAKLYALLKGKPLKANEGTKDDPAHPAIYPTGQKSDRIEGPKKKIYDLIVKRFFATFGEWAVRQTMTAKIDVNTEIFVAKGTTTVDKGWHVLYEPYSKQKEEELPPLKEGGMVKVQEIKKLSKQTEPPKRYTQASLIKELEKRNLGTKSTRAQIIDSLADRGYLDGKALEASELGIKTIEVLEKYSPRIVEEELTRHFEEEMDSIREKKETGAKVIERAKKELTEILADFKQKEGKIGEELRVSYRESMTTDVGQCPTCKKGRLVLKSSKKTRQRFLACDQYPDCRTIYPVPQKGKIVPTDQICKECNLPLIQIVGRKKQTVCFNPGCPSKKLTDTAQKKEADKIENGEVKECPQCKKGNLVLRKSVYGQFLGCSTYPACRYTQNLGAKPAPKIVEKTADKPAAQNPEVTGSKASSKVAAAAKRAASVKAPKKPKK